MVPYNCRTILFLVLIYLGGVVCVTSELVEPKHNNTPNKKTPPKPPDKKILFLHIGKAGGGTITDIIKFNNLTHKVDIWHPQGVLYGRMFVMYDHILINVRDPVKRAISAINYDCLTTQYGIGGTSLPCCYKQSKVNDTKKQIDNCKKRSEFVDYFKGSSNLIGEALLSKDMKIRSKAELLMDSFVHTKMDLNTHLGGDSEVLKKLLEHDVKLYITVLGKDFIPQILYQLHRVFQDVATTNEEKKQARDLGVPDMHSLHKSFANYSITSKLAEKAFSARYADDYKSIKYLGEIGCNGNARCKQGIREIVADGARLGHIIDDK